ncbi:hypothetical protein GCM10010252_59430 [Streptomyces aureoverticillatus]|nr:hypothetical protein GCM10010252_59430 [Streptomyces aureoverticillatus]
MAKDSLPHQERADTWQGKRGGRYRGRPDGHQRHDELFQLLKQASLHEQRRAQVREEVVRLRAGGTPPPRPLCPPPAPDRRGTRIGQIRVQCPRWTVESVFWAGGLAFMVMVWATRGMAVSLAIPLTAVAITARHWFVTDAPPRRTRPGGARRRRQERLANR